MKIAEFLQLFLLVAGTGLDPSADGPPTGGYEPNNLINLPAASGRGIMMDNIIFLRIKMRGI